MTIKDAYRKTPPSDELFLSRSVVSFNSVVDSGAKIRRGKCFSQEEINDCLSCHKNECTNCKRYS